MFVLKMSNLGPMAWDRHGYLYTQSWARGHFWLKIYISKLNKELPETILEFWISIRHLHYQAHGNKSTNENLCLKNCTLEINTRVVNFIYVMKFKFALERHVGREAKKHAHTCTTQWGERTYPYSLVSAVMPCYSATTEEPAHIRMTQSG